MRMYSFYAKNDVRMERLGTTPHISRLGAAKMFAQRKCLPLKVFLQIFGISK